MLQCAEADEGYVRRMASFKGVPFHVESGSENYGRQIVTHEFPLIDLPYLEDMRKKTGKITISGYVSGPGWLSQRDALVAACNSPGVGTLIHPFYAQPMLVACEACDPSVSKDTIGKINFSLTFIEQFNPGGFGLSIGFLGAQVSASVDLAVGVALTAFAGSSL